MTSGTGGGGGGGKWQWSESSSMVWQILKVRKEKKKKEEKKKQQQRKRNELSLIFICLNRKNGKNKWQKNWAHDSANICNDCCFMRTRKDLLKAYFVVGPVINSRPVSLKFLVLSISSFELTLF